MRLRHINQFADNQLRQGRGYIDDETFSKFCLEWGFKWIFSSASVIKLRGVKHVVCWKCKKFGRRNRFKSHESNCEYDVECDAC